MKYSPADASVQVAVMRVGSIFQLLWHVGVTHRAWSLFFNDWTFPHVSLLPELLLSTTWWRTTMAWIYVSSLVLQLFMPSVFLTVATAASFVIHACGDVSHIQPPVLHGLALLVLSTTRSTSRTSTSAPSNSNLTAARIVLSGTWMWSGLHKLNPNFLSQSSNVMDPVFSWVFPTDFVEQYRIGLHLAVALTETGVGFILLLAAMLPIKQTSASLWTTSRRLAVRVSVLLLVSMHAVIIHRLLQTRWNYSVIGWNVNCLILAIVLWWWQPLEDTKKNQHCAVAVKANTAAIVFFVLLPALVTVDCLDPYLGSSLYSVNLPRLEIELPANHAGLIDLYQQAWGINHDRVPALEQTGRVIYYTDHLTMHVQASGGGVGYPAVWAHRQFVSALCQQLQDVLGDDASVLEEARFYLQLPYTGKLLVQSLWAMMMTTLQSNDNHERPPIPPKLWRQGCSKQDDAKPDVVWKPFHQPILRGGTVGYLQSDQARQANAQFVVARSNNSVPQERVEIYWVDSRTLQQKRPVGADKDEINDKKWRATLVYQGSASGGGPPLVIQTFTGHYFVAAKRDSATSSSSSGDGEVDMDNMCALEVWVVAKSESRKAHFVLDTSRGNVALRTVPGLKPCPVGSDEESPPKSHDTTTKETSSLLYKEGRDEL